MPNGNGLASDVFATQAALIVPKPGSNSLYYLFTMNTWEFATTNLKYSIIDMTLNSGLGDVTSVKNILVNNNVREQLAAVHHANGTDYWIMVHEALSQNFLAYLLTPAGLNTVPVISTTGMSYTGANRFGGIRFSHDCNKLVSVLGSTNQTNETVQVYDFDNSTGTVSNPVTLATFATIPAAYAAEFSPDNSKLYVTSYNQSHIYQFDLSVANSAATMTNIANGNFTRCGLLTGRDYKLYVGMSNTNYLSVINTPNFAGAACNYQNNAVNLGQGHTCRLGLPNSIDFICETEGKSTSVFESELLSELEVFPNPVTDEFAIYGLQFTVSEIEIYNLLGEKVYSQQPQVANLKSQTLSVDVTRLKSGVYFVKVKGERENRVAKFMKQ